MEGPVGDDEFEEDPEVLIEKCRKNRILNPEYSIFDDSDEDHRKKRSENTVFKQDYMRVWDTTNAFKGVGCGNYAPLTPSRRHMSN